MAPLAGGHYQVVLGGRLASGALADKLLIFESDGKSQKHDAAPRLDPALVDYANGVFAMGGFDAKGAPLSTTSFIQLYQSTDGSPPPGTASPHLSVARGELCAVKLNNNSVLAVGGRAASGASTATDLFSAASNSGLVVQVADPLNTARYLHTCTLLENGMLVVAGGIDAKGQATETIEIYTPKPIDYPAW